MSKFDRMSNEEVQKTSKTLQKEGFKILMASIYRKEAITDYYVVYYRGKNFAIFPKNSLETYECYNNLKSYKSSYISSPFYEQETILSMVKSILGDDINDYQLFISTLTNLVVNLSHVDTDSKESFEKMQDIVTQQDFVRWTKEGQGREILDELRINFIEG